MEKDNRFSMIAIGIVVGLLVMVCVLVIAYFFFFQKKGDETAPTATSFTPVVTLVTATKPDVSIPVETNPAPTPTSAYPIISAQVATNCRKGPGTNFEKVGILLEGEESEVHGRNATNSWWYIRNPTDPQGFCWVWGETTTVTGDIASIPIATPPAAPPPQADVMFYATFTNKYKCGHSVGFFFQITNAGVLPLKSMEITIIDLTTGENLIGPIYNNAPFMLESGLCPPGTENLEPGKSAYLGALLLKDPLSNHDARAIIKLCSEELQKGTCLEQYVTFKTP